MSSLVISDFDGVIADITQHVRIAQQRASAFVLEQEPRLQGEAERKALSTFFYSERGFFDSQLVEYDRPVAGCQQALTRLSQEYGRMVVLTSRPPSMREATLQWFSKWCPGHENIPFLFKDVDERVERTATWKARTVAELAKQYQSILFIDDDERNRRAVETIAVDLSGVAILVTSSFEQYLFMAPPGPCRSET